MDCKIMPHLLVILLLLTCASAWALPPLPTDTAPKHPGPEHAITNQAQSVLLFKNQPASEWELTLEHADNAVAYPIKIQVPFEHLNEFVFIRSRKVTPAQSGCVGLPTERIVMPPVEGPHTIMIYDSADKQFVLAKEYDGSGIVSFDVPKWGRWYKLGLYDAGDECVFTKWIGHFIIN